MIRGRAEENSDTTKIVFITDTSVTLLPVAATSPLSPYGFLLERSCHVTPAPPEAFIVRHDTGYLLDLHFSSIEKLIVGEKYATVPLDDNRCQRYTQALNLGQQRHLSSAPLVLYVANF